MSLISRAADTFYAFRFLRLLTTPWENTGAFKAGILDKDGKLLRKPETSDDKAVYNFFHRLVFNIKRLLNKIPFGKTTIASYITALFLIKEASGLSDHELNDLLNEATNCGDLDFELNEDFVNFSLPAGNYVLNKDLPLPKTYEILALEGSDIEVRVDAAPIGSVFGFPIYEVFHVQTKSKIFINLNDIK